MSVPAVLSTFAAFKEDLDTHYDRRERLVKVSRDVTALSKKIIFSLLRTPIPSRLVPGPIASDIARHKAQIALLLASAARDLAGLNAWRYQRTISPGVQELVEALTLEHYILHECVPAAAVIQGMIGEVTLTQADYVLGVADLTGELTRRAIAALAVPGDEALDYTRRICLCLRGLNASYKALDTGAHAEGLRELGKKVSVMESSLRKVETGIFQRCVRGSERQEGWVGDTGE